MDVKIKGYEKYLSSLCFILSFLGLPCHIFAGDIQINFPISIPIQQTSKLTIDIHESLPVLNLSSRAKQVIKFDVAVNPKKEAASTLPFVFTLRDIFVDLCVNQEEIIFDPRTKQSVIPLMQFARLIDRQIHLSIDEQGMIVDEEQEIKKLIKDFPALNDLPIKIFLTDVFRHLFAFAGKELKVGSTFQQSCGDSQNCLPATLTYEITDITPDEVVAKISGTIDSRSLILNVPVTFEDQNQEKVAMTLSGTLQGEISWNRANSLLYGLKTEYDYKADLKAGDVQWTMQMNIEHKVSSSR